MSIANRLLGVLILAVVVSLIALGPRIYHWWAPNAERRWTELGFDRFIPLKGLMAFSNILIVLWCACILFYAALVGIRLVVGSQPF